jgi:hypothetical protein
MCWEVAGSGCRADTEQKRHREHLTVQLTWSFIMGMSTEERQGHAEGNTALLWALVVGFPH